MSETGKQGKTPTTQRLELRTHRKNSLVSRLVGRLLARVHESDDLNSGSRFLLMIFLELVHSKCSKGHGHLITTKESTDAQEDFYPKLVGQVLVILGPESLR